MGTVGHNPEFLLAPTLALTLKYSGEAGVYYDIL